MKKIFALLVSALFVVACGSSKDDDPAPVVDPDVTLPSLDNKSGGVYYAMSKESFRIFKLNLKNGDDKMICQMFDGLEYITIEGEATSWKPGQSLTYYAFEKDGVKLSMAINATDLTSFTFESEGKVEELITRKSSVKSPVLVYFDSDMKSYDKGYDNGYVSSRVALLLQNDFCYFIDYIFHVNNIPGVAVNYVNNSFQQKIFNKTNDGFSIFYFDNDDVPEAKKTVKLSLKSDLLVGDIDDEYNYGTFNFRQIFK